MSIESKKNQGPTCACGRVDLYEEWLKQNEQKEKEEISDSASHSGDGKSSTDDKENQKQALPKK